MIPYTVTEIQIRPIIHVGSGIGQNIPIWDIADNFGETNMLVLNMDQRRDLAKCLGRGRVALMRGHGCVVFGTNLKEVIMISIYLQVNAQLQTAAMQMAETHGREAKYLSHEEERLYSEEV